MMNLSKLTPVVLGLEESKSLCEMGIHLNTIFAWRAMPKGWITGSGTAEDPFVSKQGVEYQVGLREFPYAMTIADAPVYPAPTAQEMQTYIGETVLPKGLSITSVGSYDHTISYGSETWLGGRYVCGLPKALYLFIRDWLSARKT